MIVTFNTPKSPNVRRNDFHVNRPVGAGSILLGEFQDTLRSAQTSGLGDPMRDSLGTLGPPIRASGVGAGGQPLSARQVREGEAGTSLTASVLCADSGLRVE